MGCWLESSWESHFKLLSASGVVGSTNDCGSLGLGSNPSSADQKKVVRLMFIFSLTWWFGIFVGLILGVYVANRFSENLRWLKTVITTFWLNLRK